MFCQRAAALWAGLTAAFSNCIAPPRKSTRTVSFAANLPSRICFASGFSMLYWIARLSGRAP